jgi:hypothetical protein
MVVRSCLGQGGCRGGQVVRRPRGGEPGRPVVGRLARRARPADVARYRQIFALQEEGRFGEADQVAKTLGDRLLAGHVLAQRYLHPKAYRAQFDELAGWLEQHAELPQAQRIYRLAGARKPKGVRMPAQPTGGYLVGAGQELKEESVGEGFRRRMLPGFDAWRAGDFAGAADRFSALVGNDDRKGEELAAAAFWAARSQLRARRPHLVAGSLRRAARASDGFYGLWRSASSTRRSASSGSGRSCARRWWRSCCATRRPSGR